MAKKTTINDQTYSASDIKICYSNMTCYIKHIIKRLNFVFSHALIDTAPVLFIYSSHLTVLAKSSKFKCLRLS